MAVIEKHIFVGKGAVLIRAVQVQLTSPDQSVVLALGDVADGFKLFGPFKPDELAGKLQELPPEAWSIIPLRDEQELKELTAAAKPLQDAVVQVAKAQAAQEGKSFDVNTLFGLFGEKGDDDDNKPN